MKASELITNLANIISSEGDIEVVRTGNGQNNGHFVSGVTTWLVEVIEVKGEYYLDWNDSESENVRDVLFVG